MEIKFETLSPSHAGGGVQMSVKIDVADDASDGDIVKAALAAFEAHRLTADAQREWAVEQLTPEQLAMLESAKQQTMQPRPTTPMPKMATAIPKQKR